MCKSADLLLMVLDAGKPHYHREILTRELESVGIRSVCGGRGACEAASLGAVAGSAAGAGMMSACWLAGDLRTPTQRCKPPMRHRQVEPQAAGH